MEPRPSEKCVSQKVLPPSGHASDVVHGSSVLCTALLPLPDTFALCHAVVINQAVHERADLWPEPMRFDPSRFFEAWAPYTYLPFIDGPRNCLGQHLSLLESKVFHLLLY